MRRFHVIDCAQRSPEWFAARVGRLTASNAKDMLATIRNGEAAARRDLRTKLVVERLTGTPQESDYINEAMQWGIAHEADAFAAYEALTGQVAARVGFLAHDELMAGGSPDGVLGDCEGLLELKCPKSATHWGYLRGEKTYPPEHYAQLLHLLWLTDARYIDFLSFDPRFPPKLRTFYIRLERHNDSLAMYDGKIRAFLGEVELEVSAAQGWDVIKEQVSA